MMPDLPSWAEMPWAISPMQVGSTASSKPSYKTPSKSLTTIDFSIHFHENRSHGLVFFTLLLCILAIVHSSSIVSTVDISTSSDSCLSFSFFLLDTGFRFHFDDAFLGWLHDSCMGSYLW